jgi:hypothetical protein
VVGDITLSDHAQLKLEVLAQHGFVIEAETVIQAVKTPDQVEDGYQGRWPRKRLAAHTFFGLCMRKVQRVFWW